MNCSGGLPGIIRGETIARGTGRARDLPARPHANAVALLHVSARPSARCSTVCQRGFGSSTSADPVMAAGPAGRIHQVPAPERLQGIRGDLS